jgi:hypothetical protein
MRRTALALAALLPLAACEDNLTHPDRADYTGEDGTPFECLPNLDGRIDSSEMRAAFGVSVAYLINPAGTERTVDVAGAVDPSGHYLWDWASDFVDDAVLRVSAAELHDQWYAGSFPDGQFVVPLDAAGTADSIYRRDDEALWLLGMASTQADPPEGRTLLVYDAPVAVFRFPIEPDRTWISVGEVRDGLYRGLPYAGRDTYEASVDGAGRLLLPDLEFTHAMRVRTRVTAEPSVGVPTSRRQVSFLFECFGEVARATSRADEPAEDFTTATEWRRFGLGL